MIKSKIEIPANTCVFQSMVFLLDIPFEVLFEPYKHMWSNDGMTPDQAKLIFKNHGYKMNNKIKGYNGKTYFEILKKLNSGKYLIWFSDHVIAWKERTIFDADFTHHSTKVSFISKIT